MKIDKKYLLEQYVLGKDEDQNEILEKIFLEDAEVDFEIRSEKISFPEKIEGHLAIAKTLSADFNKKYEKVKTYYLDAIPPDAEKVEKQPWLVVMKERGSDITRVGTGYYNWEFSEKGADLLIKRMKIYIHEMLEVEDQNSTLLAEIQRELGYPWPSKSDAIQVLQRFKELLVIKEYLSSDGE